VGLLRGILVRLRPAVVLPARVLPARVLPVTVVLLLVAVPVAGVPVALAVPVLLVALAVAVMLLLALVLLGRMAGTAVIVIVALARRLFSDSGLRSRGDAATGRALIRRNPREGRGDPRARRGGPSGCACRRRLARPGRRRLPRAARGAGRAGCDDRRDLAGSGRGSRDCGLVAGEIQESRRSQYEADGGQYGEYAGHGCGYARKTAPHKVSHRRASACLESYPGDSDFTTPP
jgi:hypothetical protein